MPFNRHICDQGLLNIGQESTKQLGDKDKELTAAQNELRDTKKELQTATWALEAMEEDEVRFNSILIPF